MKSVVALIDGGHLRAAAQNQQIKFDPDFIEDFCKSLPIENEDLQKILYYDCKPFSGTKTLPISGNEREFNQTGQWLDDLSERDLFAVRYGQLKFRGWTPKTRAIGGALDKDADFKPNFEQKGVDMRIGIDIANISNSRFYDGILLVSADTDMIPAMKEARKAGIQVAIYQLPYHSDREHRDRLKVDLKAHADFIRDVAWPANRLSASDLP